MRGENVVRDLVILLIDETGLAVAIPILPIGSWLGQTPLSSVPTDEPKQTNKQTTASQRNTHMVAAEGRWWVLLLRLSRPTRPMCGEVECEFENSQASR